MDTLHSFNSVPDMDRDLARIYNTGDDDDSNGKDGIPPVVAVKVSPSSLSYSSCDCLFFISFNINKQYLDGVVESKGGKSSTGQYNRQSNEIDDEDVLGKSNGKDIEKQTVSISVLKCKRYEIILMVNARIAHVFRIASDASCNYDVVSATFLHSENDSMLTLVILMQDGKIISFDLNTLLQPRMMKEKIIDIDLRKSNTKWLRIHKEIEFATTTIPFSSNQIGVIGTCCSPTVYSIESDEIHQLISLDDGFGVSCLKFFDQHSLSYRAKSKIMNPDVAITNTSFALAGYQNGNVVYLNLSEPRRKEILFNLGEPILDIIQNGNYLMIAGVHGKIILVDDVIDATRYDINLLATTISIPIISIDQIQLFSYKDKEQTNHSEVLIVFRSGHNLLHVRLNKHKNFQVVVDRFPGMLHACIMLCESENPLENKSKIMYYLGNGVVQMQSIKTIMIGCKASNAPNEHGLMNHLSQLESKINRKTEMENSLRQIDSKIVSLSSYISLMKHPEQIMAIITVEPCGQYLQQTHMTSCLLKMQFIGVGASAALILTLKKSIFVVQVGNADHYSISPSVANDKINESSTSTLNEIHLVQLINLPPSFQPFDVNIWVTSSDVDIPIFFCLSSRRFDILDLCMDSFASESYESLAFKELSRNNDLNDDDSLKVQQYSSLCFDLPQMTIAASGKNALEQILSQLDQKMWSIRTIGAQNGGNKIVTSNLVQKRIRFSVEQFIIKSDLNDLSTRTRIRITASNDVTSTLIKEALLYRITQYQLTSRNAGDEKLIGDSKLSQIQSKTIEIIDKLQKSNDFLNDPSLMHIVSRDVGNAFQSCKELYSFMYSE